LGKVEKCPKCGTHMVAMGAIWKCPKCDHEMPKEK